MLALFKLLVQNVVDYFAFLGFSALPVPLSSMPSDKSTSEPDAFHPQNGVTMVLIEPPSASPHSEDEPRWNLSHFMQKAGGKPPPPPPPPVKLPATQPTLPPAPPEKPLPSPTPPSPDPPIPGHRASAVTHSRTIEPSAEAARSTNKLVYPSKSTVRIPGNTIVFWSVWVIHRCVNIIGFYSGFLHADIEFGTTEK